MTLKVAPIFSNNMVLQREKNIIVWGTGKDNSVITVTLDGSIAKSRVRNGKWEAVLPDRKAGGPYTLSITDGKDTISFNNVMVGEVWLAGGQSNMELEFRNSKNGEEILKTVENDKLRFYAATKLSYIDEEFLKQEESSYWQECNSENAKTWSAVAYYYAKELSEALDVTVGIIGCNWGGTSASNWMSTEALSMDKDTNTYVQEYDKANEGRTLEEYLKELDEYKAWYEVWHKKVDALYAENPEILWSEVLRIAGESKWPGPMGPKSEYRPGGLYETMIKRLVPYTLRGFIYYQGESDDHKPKTYYKLFNKLIEQWRSDWRDDELPFIFVQLPMFIGKEDEDKKNWAIIREAQMKVHKTFKNTGIAVALDCGEFNNIHPVDKEPVGHRLSLQALYHVYHKNVAAYGPIYKTMRCLDNKLILEFDYAEDGIVVKGDKIIGFYIAGADKEFFGADAEIQGDKIIVSSKEVSEPQYVRYQWTNYGEVTLFNKAWLPVAPFRTSVNDEK